MNIVALVLAMGMAQLTLSQLSAEPRERFVTPIDREPRTPPAPKPKPAWNPGLQGRFCAEYYLETYPDVARSVRSNHADALLHFLAFGRREGRSPNPFYDPVFYLNTHPDLRRAFGTDYDALFHHWVNSGIAEGRQGSAIFGGHFYLETYPDVAKVYGERNHVGALQHWIKHGISEGRKGAPGEHFTAYAKTELVAGPIKWVSKNWPRIKELGGKAYDWVEKGYLVYSIQKDVRDEFKDKNEKADVGSHSRRVEVWREKRSNDSLFRALPIDDQGAWVDSEIAND